MVEGKTKSGFDFILSDDAMDDWDLLESLRKIDKGEQQYIIDAAIQLLGENQYNKLKDFLRQKNGKLNATIMSTNIMEIITSSDNKDLKNL